MSIGVSYTGHDGRRAEFSVQDAQDAAARMSGLSGRSMQEAMNDAQGLLRTARRTGASKPPQQTQKPSRDKVMAGGSVVRSAEGSLCLRGEETTPLIPGTKMFGAHNGSKGFFSFDEIDPPLHGEVIGKDVGDNSQSLDPNNDKKDLPDGVAWATREQTDERAEISKETGLITVYKYFRKKYHSAIGRVVGCSAEWREVAYAFLPGSGGGTGGMTSPIVLAGANSIIGQVNCNSSEALECFWRMVTGKRDDDELVIPVSTADYVAPYNFSSTGGYLDLWEFMNGLNEAFQQVLSQKSTSEKQLRGVVASCVSGLYAVRPIWTARSGTGTYNTPYADQEGVQYSLYALDFGTEAQLATWAGDKYLCDYDEEGELRETPVVKRLYVSSCPAGRSV